MGLNIYVNRSHAVFVYISDIMLIRFVVCFNCCFDLVFTALSSLFGPCTASRTSYRSMCMSQSEFILWKLIATSSCAYDDMIFCIRLQHKSHRPMHTVDVVLIGLTQKLSGSCFLVLFFILLLLLLLLSVFQLHIAVSAFPFPLTIFIVDKFSVRRMQTTCNICKCIASIRLKHWIRTHLAVTEIKVFRTQTKSDLYFWHVISTITCDCRLAMPTCAINLWRSFLFTFRIINLE